MRTAFRLAIFCLSLIGVGGEVRTSFGQKPPAEGSVQPVKLRSGKINSNSLAGRIQMRLIELRDAFEYPGVNIGVALPDGRLISVSVGYSDPETELPLKPAQRMLAGGGIGNTFVSAVTLQLVEEGKLDLDDKIEKWLGKEPWFDRLPNGRQITLRMLMNHTSGIPERVLNKDFIKALRKQPDKVWKPEELVEYILDSKPLFGAGDGWAYADTNYILVGMIFERASGASVYDEVTRRILRPLKLKATEPSDGRVIPDLTHGYISPNSPFGVEGRTIVGGKFVINPRMEWPLRGLVSSVEDLAKWAKLLYEGRVLRQETIERLLDTASTKTGEYGLGVQTRRTDLGVSFGHGGWAPGYRSEVEYFPKQRIAIAVQFNIDNFGQSKRDTRDYTLEIAKVVFDFIDHKPQLQ
ncbi:MAG: serine hydrolase domain-containing protein [Blastocatellia bacterium]